ncbi:unnamed protein product [Mortierella alpina]
MRVTFSPAPVEPATTKNDIWAWYSYAFASEAYVVVALTSFIPITLEALASAQGHLYGTNEPCHAPPSTVEPPTQAAGGRPRCMISFGRLELDTASFVMYLTSLAVLLQALTVVSISSMADYGPYRKKQLIFFSLAGSVATMLIGAVPYVWMAGTLSVIANVSFGAGIVCFNAYLPLLVRNVDRIRLGRQELQQLEKETEFQAAHLVQSRPTSTQPSQDNINERSAAVSLNPTETALLDNQDTLATPPTEPVPTFESIEQRSCTPNYQNS